VKTYGFPIITLEDNYGARLSRQDSTKLVNLPILSFKRSLELELILFDASTHIWQFCILTRRALPLINALSHLVGL